VAAQRELSSSSPELLERENENPDRTLYLPPERWEEPYVVEGEEARHLLRVLRAKEGETVRLMDGQGREGIFRIESCKKDRANLTPQRIIQHTPPQGRTVLALAWTKSLRRSWLLEKSVELEASAIWLWRADRSQGSLPDEIKTTWRNQLIAGAKQCRNPFLPELRLFPDGIGQVLAKGPEFDQCFVLWENQEEPHLLRHEEIAAQNRTLFILGPEGGFTSREIETALAAKALPVSLGNRVLRWETAALLCLGLAWWGKQTP
jgi:16S rRNA (uracil1498-N3)-methyltransferase